MGQPKDVSAYGTEHLAVLLDATLTPQEILFPPTDGDMSTAKRRATAFVHRTNGLKRALVAAKHPMSADCSNVRVRMPRQGEDGWLVVMERAGLWGKDMIRLTQQAHTQEPTQESSQAPSPKRSYSTPELDFNAILSDGEI